VTARSPPPPLSQRRAPKSAARRAILGRGWRVTRPQPCPRNRAFSPAVLPPWQRKVARDGPAQPPPPRPLAAAGGMPAAARARPLGGPAPAPFDGRGPVAGAGTSCTPHCTPAASLPPIAPAGTTGGTPCIVSALPSGTSCPGPYSSRTPVRLAKSALTSLGLALVEPGEGLLAVQAGRLGRLRRCTTRGWITIPPPVPGAQTYPLDHQPAAGWVTVWAPLKPLTPVKVVERLGGCRDTVYRPPRSRLRERRPDPPTRRTSRGTLLSLGEAPRPGGSSSSALASRRPSSAPAAGCLLCGRERPLERSVCHGQGAGTERRTRFSVIHPEPPRRRRTSASAEGAAFLVRGVRARLGAVSSSSANSSRLLTSGRGPGPWRCKSPWAIQRQTAGPRARTGRLVRLVGHPARSPQDVLRAALGPSLRATTTFDKSGSCRFTPPSRGSWSPRSPEARAREEPPPSLRSSTWSCHRANQHRQ